MSNLHVVEIKAFVPSKDFALSKQFYQDLGFTMASDSNGVAYFRHVDASFLLQDFYVREHVDNFQMHLLVDDVETWHRQATEVAGRFNVETFIVAPASVPAPVVFNNPPFPDASANPKTGPIHTYHLGVWFDSPADAIKAGCPGNVTPFNGDHQAGIQVLNTSNFPDLQGPLSKVVPKP